MTQKTRMRDGDAILVMVKDGEVVHHSWNMSLPHVEFVKRSTGQLPDGAWGRHGLEARWGDHGYDFKVFLRLAASRAARCRCGNSAIL